MNESNQTSMMQPPKVDMRQAVRTGLIGGIVAIFIAITGMLETFAERNIVAPILTMGYMLLLLVPLITSYLAARPPKPIEGQPDPVLGIRNVIAGILAGLAAGGFLALFVIVASLFDQARLRDIFINISPTLYELLTFGQGLGPGLLLLVGLFTALGAVGGLLDLVPHRWIRPIATTIIWVLGVGLLTDVISQILREIALRSVSRFLFEGSGGLAPIGALIVAALAFIISFVMGSRGDALRERINKMPEQQQRRLSAGGYLLLAIFILVLPLIIGSFLSEVLDLVGIFAIMALGLNIVLGYAGLLDLGYVAFFAVGAYTTAVFTSANAPSCVAEPAGFCPDVNFWAALPFAMIMAAIAGIIVGTPVIRMRGDYLAIVTLGFGEIARLVIQSDWFKPILGAAQGIISIPDITIGPLELNTPPQFFYPMLGFLMLSVYALWRLQGSRVGRAWMALREDERVAEVMGINIVTTKLLAFITGAVLASFSGALFAAKIGSVFPASFDIEKSIQVLIIVIVGGLGSIPGTIAAAFLIIGVPELLREFDEYRFLAYGVLLVVMMLYKPEGLIPNRRLSRTLSEEEADQDAWLQAQPEADQTAPTPSLQPSPSKSASD